MMPWILLLGITTGLNGGGSIRYVDQWVRRGDAWRASRYSRNGNGYLVAQRNGSDHYLFRVMKRGYWR